MTTEAARIIVVVFRHNQILRSSGAWFSIAVNDPPWSVHSARIPIAILAIGSTAPGILFLPIEAYRAATANEEEKKIRGQRVCKHEASHLLCAYVLGLPIQEVATDDKGPRVVVYDEQNVQQPGVLVRAEQLDRLAVVAMSGLMAEAEAYGKALGVSEDLKLLNSLMARCTPAMPAQKQQDTSRFGTRAYVAHVHR